MVSCLVPSCVLVSHVAVACEQVLCLRVVFFRLCPHPLLHARVSFVLVFVLHSYHVFVSWFASEGLKVSQLSFVSGWLDAENQTRSSVKSLRGPDEQHHQALHGEALKGPVPGSESPDPPLSDPRRCADTLRCDEAALLGQAELPTHLRLSDSSCLLLESSVKSHTCILWSFREL